MLCTHYICVRVLVNVLVCVFQKAIEVDLDRIMDFDSQCFILKESPLRKPFLQHWIQIPGSAAYVAQNQKNQVEGFGCRRPSLQNGEHMIGPLYAVNRDIAHALLGFLCADVVGDTVLLIIK